MGAFRSGFTLLELMVCVAIIMILAGMLVVGIQVVQETTSRLECINHLRELGHALHNYHLVYATFPNETYPRNRDTLLYVAILPFVEEQAQDLDDPGFVRVFTCPTRRPSTITGKDDFAIPRHTGITNSILGGQHAGLPNYPGTNLDQVQHADGASSSILLSHKRLPGMYYEQDMGAASSGMDIGWARFIAIGASSPKVDYDHHRTTEPRRDHYSLGGQQDFGSPHDLGSPTLWADGRVSLYSYRVYGNGQWTASCFWNDSQTPNLDEIEP